MAGDNSAATATAAAQTMRRRPAATPAPGNPRAAPLTGLAAQYFTDPAVFARARERIFFRAWQFACHASQTPAPGDYFAFSLCGESLFVMRGRDGNLRAFYNVCRHRGHPLVEDGGGKRATVVCPYHAWSYELDGRLRAAPNANRVPGFDKRNIRLREVKLEEFLGFVFVNLDEQAKPMDACYPGVREAALALCPDIEARALAHAFSAREPCNWLVAVENYNECYHCPTAHRSFAEGIIDPDSYNIALFGDERGGRCLRHESKATKSARAWYDVSGSDYGSFYLWPAFSLQVYPGRVVNSYHWRPLQVDATEVHRAWYSVDGAVDEKLQTVIDLDRDTTFAEDLKLVSGVQRGIASRGFVPGPLMVDPNGGIGNELSIAALHGWLREAVDAVDDSSTV